MYEDALGSRAAAGRLPSSKAVAPVCTKVARARIRQVAVSVSPQQTQLLSTSTASHTTVHVLSSNPLWSVPIADVCRVTFTSGREWLVRTSGPHGAARLLLFRLNPSGPVKERSKQEVPRIHPRDSQLIGLSDCCPGKGDFKANQCIYFELG